MAGFKGISERFRVNMMNSEGYSERVTVQLGMDGLAIFNAEGTTKKRAYELSHISRWQATGGTLVLYTRTPVDLEERQLTLTGDEHTIRNVLDTLTCCCMQLSELLQSGRGAGDLEAANNLHALAAGGGRKKPSALPTADNIQYWRQPEKAGWLQCQGEKMGLWRKRWFVLKQGHLFRFWDDKVSEAAKPRGVVDLSKVQDVKDGRSASGRPNSIQLKTAAGGFALYAADSETEAVEWMSALEGAVHKIARHLAGVEDEQPSRPAAKAPAGRPSAGMSSAARSGSGMVDIVGYESTGGGGGGGGYYSSGGDYGYGGGGGGLDLGNIAGVAGVAAGGGADYGYPSSSGGSGLYPRAPVMDDLSLNYGSGGGRASGAGSGYSRPGGSGIAGGYPSVPSALLNAPGPSSGGYSPQHMAPYSAASAAYGGGMAGGGGAYGGAVSVLDQIPTQQPAYPVFQQSPEVAAAPPMPPPPPAGGWQVHYTPEGRPYYFNAASGVTQWEAPAGMH